VQDAAETLDFSQPTAVLMLGILSEVPDSDSPGSIVAQVLGCLPAGSYLALSDVTNANPAFRQAISVYNGKAASPCHLRSPQRLAGFFEGLEMVPPGLVAPSQWRPGLTDTSGGTEEVSALCGIGRKG
jgi:S-adenosyl methyltransferase